MAAHEEDRDRQVVPRLRSPRAIHSLRENAPLSPSKEKVFPQEAIAKLVSDWKREPSLSFASDLVATAWTLGISRAALDAAHFVLASDIAPRSARSIAALYLRDAGETTDVPASEYEGLLVTGDDVAPTPHFHRQYWIQIRDARRQLKLYSRDPIQWVNLGRLYAALGEREKAARAMSTALKLAPDDRFVLRSFSRLLLHQGDRKRAQDVLSRSQIVKTDPWVLSAEIATADAARKSSRFIKAARRIVDSGRYPPAHLSELASALATLEASAGNRKGCRKFLATSLESPTENAIAQAVWLGRKFGLQAAAGFGSSGSAEADAWLAVVSSQWQKGLQASLNWLIDQPFSSRPVVVGGLIAHTALGNPDLAISFYKHGYRSNREDFAIQNNYAFSLALNNDLPNANKIIRAIDLHSLDRGQKIVLTATQGLIAFRSGDSAKGRMLYKEAIEDAKAIRDKTRENLARIWRAFEELRIGSPEAEELRKEAVVEAGELTESWHIALNERLRLYRRVL